MAKVDTRYEKIRTLLSFSLIPLSGFATDIYLPSFPSISSDLHIPNSAVQLTLVIFMITYGAGQFFVGSILDSFGRYRLGAVSLFVFALSSFIIALSKDINVIYVMRLVQGLTVALIVVGKRAYFIDTFTGEKLKSYASLFSIIWATAPIIAPFIGGYLQTGFGWQSNFYMLGGLTLVLLLLELKFGRESLTTFQPFQPREIFKVYITMVGTLDFTFGLIIIALNYTMLVVYGMSAPFIIEKVFSLPSLLTGYCALLSGLFFMMGGIISKLFIKKGFVQKLVVGVSLQLIMTVIMLFVTEFIANIYLLMSFTLLIHFLSGFVFNNVFAYCLRRFSSNAGIASGITGGLLYVLTSIFSYGAAYTLAINNTSVLATAYLFFAFGTCLMSYLFIKSNKDRGSAY